VEKKLRFDVITKTFLHQQNKPILKQHQSPIVFNAAFYRVIFFALFFE